MVQNTEPGKPDIPPAQQQQQQASSSIAQPVAQTIQQIQPPDENSLEAAPQTEIPPSPAINGSTSTTPVNQIQQQQQQQHQQPNGHVVPNGQMDNNDEKQVPSTDAES